MGYTQLTLNSSNISVLDTSNDAVSTDFDVSGGSMFIVNGYTQVNNSEADFDLICTFNTPQLLNKIILSFSAGSGTHSGRDFTVLFSEDGITYNSTNVIGVTTDSNPVEDNTSFGDLEFTFTQPNINPIKFKSFKISFTDFNGTTVKIDKLFAYIPDDLGSYSYADYNVEFDDALLDLAGWKNPRYNGSKLTGARINQFRKGDVSYGLNPVIENKTACIFLGKDIDEGDADDEKTDIVEISNHSYITINKILFVDLDTDDVEIISRENMNEVAFNRIVTENFPESSKIIVKSLEEDPNKLKPEHFVKFNQGRLMKIYSYHPHLTDIDNHESQGYDDGVFGGYGLWDHKGTHQAIHSGAGFFGYGQSLGASQSLFSTNSFIFTNQFPAELSFYEGNYSVETMGTTLTDLTSSVSGGFGGGSTIENASNNASSKSDIRLKENIIYLRKSLLGIPIYKFNYIGKSNTYIGTMAQDLLKLGFNEAVIKDPDGYYSVNYNLIDVNMKQI